MLKFGKRAAVVAFFSSLFFLIAGLLFLDHIYEDRDNNLYFDIIDSAKEGDRCKFFIEKSAELAAYDSLDKHKQITRDFNNIDGYLVVFNSICDSDLKYTDFAVSPKLDIKDPYMRVEKVFVSGKTEKKVLVEKGNVTYSFSPDFDIEVYK